MKQKGTPQRAAAETPSWFDKLSERKKDLLSIGVLALIVYVLFFKVVFSGYVFSTETDTAAQESWSKAMVHIAETEHVEPLWVPYIFSGMPVFGPLLFPRDVNYVEVVFRWICKILFPTANPWFVPHFLLVGIGMFLLCRHLKFAALPSLFASVVIMLNPYLMGLPAAGHGSKLAVFSLLPFVFLATMKLFETKKIVYVGLLGGAMGWMYLLRHPQIAFYILLVIGVYLVFQVVADIRQKALGSAATKAALFAAAFAIGFAIYAYEFLPTQEYARYSIRGGSGDGSVTSGLSYDYATNWSLHPLEMSTYVIPSMFGFSSSYVADWNGEARPLPLYWGWMPFTDAPPYVGLLPVLLSVFALVYRRNAMTWFLAVLSAIVFLISFGNYFGVLYNLLFYYMPFFNKFRAPSMILYLIPFSLGLLGAYGLSFLIDLQTAAKNFTPAVLRKRLMVLLGLLGGILVVAFLAKSALFGFLSDFMFAKTGDLQTYGAQVVGIFKEKRFDLFWSDYVKMTVIAGAFLYAAAMAIDRKIARSAFAAICIVITVADLLILDVKFINPVPASELAGTFETDQTTKFLQADTSFYRIFPVGNLFQDNTYMYHTVSSIGGYSPAKLKIYQEMIDSSLYVSGDATIPLNMNVVNMLGTKYIVAPGRLPEGKFTLVNQDAAKKLLTYLNPGAFPHAWFVDGVVTAPSRSGVFRLMNEPAWDPRKTAVLEKAPSSPVAPADSATAIVTHNGSQSMTIGTQSAHQSLLVVSEVYYPAGWTASVDGQPTEIYKTNYVLRSVVVPAGRHEVTFTFAPESLSKGFTVSRIGWAIALLIVLAGAFQLTAVRARFWGKKVEEQPASQA